MLSQMILDVEAFLETGGGVLNVIGLVTIVMWTLMLERFWYFYRVFPQVADEIQAEWKARGDHSSWAAHQIRRLKVSELRMDLEDGLAYIRVLVALCPLLGLLGTVTGMIETFRSLGEMQLFTQGGGVAGGIGEALLTTQMGLAVAVPGVVGGRLLDRRQAVLEGDLDQLEGLACVPAREAA